jgi:hypothetical protein
MEVKQEEDLYALFVSYGFDVDVASSASTFVHGKKRSKKPKSTKYLEALWSAHNKHHVPVTLDVLRERVGVTSATKLQPETGRVEIRNTLSLINYYAKNSRLIFLSAENIEKCRQLASLVDENDGLPAIVTDVVVAIVRHVIEKDKSVSMRKDELCKKFSRPVTSVTQATRLLDDFLTTREIA